MKDKLKAGLIDNGGTFVKEMPKDPGRIVAMTTFKDVVYIASERSEDMKRPESLGEYLISHGLSEYIDNWILDTIKGGTMKRPEKKERNPNIFALYDTDIVKESHAVGYNQAIDDMDMWFDSLPLLPSKDKVLHGLRKAKE